MWLFISQCYSMYFLILLSLTFVHRRSSEFNAAFDITHLIVVISDICQEFSQQKNKKHRKFKIRQTKTFLRE